MGDQVILYDELVVKSGSDYDIDKLYMAIPEYKITTKKSSDIAKIIVNSENTDAYSLSQILYDNDLLTDAEFDNILDSIKGANATNYNEINNKLKSDLFDKFVSLLDHDLTDSLITDIKRVAGIDISESLGVVKIERVKSSFSKDIGSSIFVDYDKVNSLTNQKNEIIQRQEDRALELSSSYEYLDRAMEQSVIYKDENLNDCSAS
jgi:hypothetical protein